MKTKLFGGLLVAMGCALGLQPAAAATATFFGTGTGLGARADFTTSAGLLAVTVTNTLAANQIISAGQAVSDYNFYPQQRTRHSWSHHCLGSIGAMSARVAVSRT